MSTEATVCLCISGSDQCYPNPCMNNGNCSSAGDQFSCNCKGTGHGGLTCQTPIVYFQPITRGTSIQLSIFTEARLGLKSRAIVKGPNKFETTTRLDLEPGQSSVTHMADGIKGVMVIELRPEYEHIMYEPQKQTVFIPGSGRSRYFENFNLTRGQLKPSGCPPTTDIMICPATTQAISLLSSCEWNVNDKDANTTLGVVFAEGGNLTLPVSITGLVYRNDDIINRPFMRNNMDCVQCLNCTSTDDRYCYDVTLSDAVDFINARALAFTYIGEIKKLLPSWVSLSVNLTYALNSSQLRDYDTFAKITQQQEQVSSIIGCNKLVGLQNSLYSVMRYDKTLSATIDGSQYHYIERSDIENTGDPMCFAVDLCHETEPPIHMQISTAINDILVSQYLHHLSSRQWTIHFNTISLYKTPKVIKESMRFWNGAEIIEPSDISVDVSINVDAEIVFKNDPDDGSLSMALTFNGNALLDYTVSAASSL